jgi:hypothetical protein
MACHFVAAGYGADITDSHRRSAYERAARLYLTDHIKLAEGRG